MGELRGDDLDTFANIRLKNLLLPGSEGGVTVHLPTGDAMSVYDAAMRYQAEGTSLHRPGGTRIWSRQFPRLGR